jgi:hypothetical protein
MFLAEHGYDGTRTANIAALVGVRNGALSPCALAGLRLLVVMGSGSSRCCAVGEGE